MIKLVLGVSLVLLLALVGTRKSFARLKLPLGAREILLTGNEFIFVGLALGGTLIGLLDDATIHSLTPLFSLGLGSIGLIFGIQFNWQRVLRFPRRYFAMTVVQALCTAIIVTLTFGGMMIGIFGYSAEQALGPALVLGATASCTGQSHLALLDTNLLHRRWSLVGLLRYMSGMDAVVGLAIFGFAFCLAHQTPLMGFALGVSIQWFVFSIGLGVIMGFLLHLLTQVQCRDDELLTFVVGMVIFSGGISLYFKLSPLFINMIMGLAAANLPGSKDRILNLLTHLEKPFYIVFLILAGAAWQLGSPWAFLGALAYLLVRFVGKLCGGALAARMAKPRRAFSPGLGLGMISQGGMVIAMVISYQQLHASQVGHVIVTMVLVGVLLSELMGSEFAKRLLESEERAI